VIRLFAYSYEVIPVGAAPVIGPVILSYLIHLFGTVFLMVIKLTLPFLAAEFILEATMGVLMKLIPQIHVFVINIQSKILLGILLMIAFAYPVGAFFDEYVARLMGEIQNVLMMFA
jgi:flagellar biosynthetic protein FliR